MKHFKLILLSIVFPLVLLGSHSSGAEDNPWQARLSIPSSRVLVGEPVSIRVEIMNSSGGEIIMPVGFGLCARFCGLGVRGPESDCMGGPGCAAVAPLPIYLTKQTYKPGVSDVITSDSNYPHCPGIYTAQFGCNVPETAAQAELNLKTAAWESNDEVWTGSFSSNVVNFEVVEPQGIDKEAYEAFGPTVVEDPRNRADLLRRFPTSTYAAYVIWQKYAKDWSQVETDRAVATLERPYPFRTVLAPCDVTGLPAGGQETRFGPKELFRCRVAWMERVLGHHPHVWFADEVRLRLALDRYRLDDKTACAAGLEALSEYAKSGVAEKARALLEAMQAKGMLPGGAKSPAASEAETGVSGSTAK